MSHPASSPASSARHPLYAALALALATLLAWANSFSGPFVFDDRPAILANPTLEHFSTALSPPRDGGTVAGRPLVNLSLALNRALSGVHVGSYHALNLALHLAAALTLFGLVRRTLIARSPAHATSTAFCAALLWAVHPLQTAAVTYTIQRAEALMALCFLLTLYGFVRGTSGGNCRWLTFSVVVCLAGMASKEAMAVAPLIVLLYDRTFVAGTFSAALRARHRYYLALASTWLLLAWLVATNASRAGTAGWSAKISPLDYAFTQSFAVTHYLRLAVWPVGLVFDYGTPLVTTLAAVWLRAGLLLALLVVSLVLFRRRTALGFLGLSFFLILAPSSSVIPIATQTIAEHRMYLPLAALTVAISLALSTWLAHRAWLVAVILAVPLAGGVHLRNRDYQFVLALWSDTVARRPNNPRAQVHLGNALVQADRQREAITHFEAALRLDPDLAEAHNNLALALAAAGRANDALPHLEASVRLNADSPSARINLANAFVRAGRFADALPHFAAAERAGPLDAATSYNYGVALAQSRQFAPAIEKFRATVAADPSHIGARVNLANVLLLSDRATEAIAEYEAALRLRPDDRQIQANLALARRQQK